MTVELYAACEQMLHVVLPDGRLLRGGRACLYILQVLGYTRTAAVLGQWPLRGVVEISYGIVARHRQFFSHFLFKRS